MSIKQDAVLAQAEPIKGLLRTLVEEEDTNESVNNCSVRRLQLIRDDMDISLANIQPFRKVEESSPEPIPSHLTGLYENLQQDLGQKRKKS